MGQKIGVLGKEGSSGGWSHLHFDIKARQPSGKWGIQEGYAFLWEAYRREHKPQIIAVARPHHLIWAGEKVSSTARAPGARRARSRATSGPSPTGPPPTGPRVERTYDKPGEIQRGPQGRRRPGRVDYDFAVVQVIDKARPTASSRRRSTRATRRPRHPPGRPGDVQGADFFARARGRDVGLRRRQPARDGPVGRERQAPWPRTATPRRSTATPSRATTSSASSGRAPAGPGRWLGSRCESVRGPTNSRRQPRPTAHRRTAGLTGQMARRSIDDPGHDGREVCGPHRRPGRAAAVRAAGPGAGAPRDDGAAPGPPAEPALLHRRERPGGLPDRLAHLVEPPGPGPEGPAEALRLRGATSTSCASGTTTSSASGPGSRPAGHPGPTARGRTPPTGSSGPNPYARTGPGDGTRRQAEVRPGEVRRRVLRPAPHAGPSRRASGGSTSR